MSMPTPHDPPPKYEEGPGYPPATGYPAGPPPQQAGYQPVPMGGYQPPPPGGYQPPPPGGYQQYPPPTGYPTQPGLQHTTVVINQPGQIAPRDGSRIRYLQSPALIICQHCQATVTTGMQYETGLLTWAVCGGLCVVGCFLGCCLIPFCIDGTKDVQHTCPNCKNIVGRFRHFS